MNVDAQSKYKLIDSFQGCNTCDAEGFGVVYNEDGHQETAATDDLYYPFGSIQILDGCTFYGFDGINYGGGVRLYEGPLTVPFVRRFNNYSYFLL